MDENTAPAVNRRDGGHGFYRVDLRSPLRSQGLSWAKIGERLGLGEGTVRRTASKSAKNPLKIVAATPMESAAN
jgi:hypothetical protein